MKKYIRGIIICIFSMMVIPDYIFALNDTEYASFIKTSPFFADAEKRLNVAWNEAKTALSKDEFSDLQVKQKDWVSYGRDYLATQFIEKQKMSRVEAYTEATVQRVLLIKKYIMPECRAPRSQTGMLSIAPSHQASGLLKEEGLIGFPDDQPSWKIIIGACKDGDRCMVTGILGINGDFLTVTSAKLAENAKHAEIVVQNDNDNTSAVNKGELKENKEKGEELFALAKEIQNGRSSGPDAHKAFELFRRAAEMGHAKSQAELGHLYEVGGGVPIDIGKAFEWRRKAAENGDGYAAYILGVRYEDGNGVQKDLKMAAKWYQKAIDNGESSTSEWALQNVLTRLRGGDFPCKQFNFKFSMGLLLLITPDNGSITKLFFDDTEFNDWWYLGNDPVIQTRTLRNFPDSVTGIQRGGTICKWNMKIQKQY